MIQCEVFHAEKCEREAQYRATKPCGCPSSLCPQCLVAAAHHVVACPTHRVWFDRGTAHAGIEAL